MDKKIIALLIVIAIVLSLFFINIEEEKIANKKPVVEIVYPKHGASVSKIITIRGNAHDPDGDDSLLEVEVMINNEWIKVNGNKEWNYEWSVFQENDGLYTIHVKAFDGKDYSEIEEVEIAIDNPASVESDAY